MQTIPETYKQAGQKMTLVKRQGMVALYANRDNSYYEVHKVRVRGTRTVFGKEIPEHETLASNEEFGQRAYACVSRERADMRFADLAGDWKPTLIMVFAWALAGHGDLESWNELP